MKRAWMLSLLFFVPSVSFAEGREGHGGGGYVCSAGPVWDFEFLDLFEGRMLDGFPPLEAEKDEDAWVAYAVSRFPLDAFSSFFSEEMKWVRVNLYTDDQESSELYHSGDAKIRLEKKGCEYVQVATYTWAQKIAVRSIFNDARFGALNRAALRVHEALYKMDRDLNGSTDSLAIRPLVAALFSGKSVDEIRGVFADRFDKSKIDDVEFAPGSSLGVYFRFLKAPRKTTCTIRFGFPFMDRPIEIEENRAGGETLQSILVSPLGKYATRRTRVDASVECVSRGHFRKQELSVQFYPSDGRFFYQLENSFLEGRMWQGAEVNGEWRRRARVIWRFVEK